MYIYIVTDSEEAGEKLVITEYTMQYFMIVDLDHLHGLNLEVQSDTK